ncbi:uncharacterized protein PHACADRAFT_84750 [Phanerochaete carnosa HHB-10118-sp]|uniref:Ubiquitin-like domain-containing protein n=1 Tax=Phanerochaete carnosa (strain HHB-10118-sp) TaxID=650164 RepID=K5WQS1_PHACS|nr:uncharacterized protein PHACADRAFT_84750 [Phanerochaete carnosa HHB-10118-sp]EKM61609.1 hypothetical protein PHACADRAFT_84750 [Phanerochaete carnosa HHB-10118-sp]
MNGAQAATRQARPPPTGPTPPAPSAAPPAPPNNANAQASSGQSPPANRQPNGPVNGAHSHAQKGKKKNDPPVDPSQLYESLKSRIATLEEEEIHNEEEERRIAEEAQSTVAGLGDSAVHQKYVELFTELKRQERDHAKEKQKLVKDKDAAKSQLTKANQTKTKMESLARELQKDNKKLREDSKRLMQSVEEANTQLTQMKLEVAKRTEKLKLQDVKYREMPDIVVKVHCKYRAELFFKISRKTKLSRLFNAWTERMEVNEKKGDAKSQPSGTSAAAGQQVNGTSGSSTLSAGAMQFIFSHGGRTLEVDQTPEEAGMEDGDEILAVEMMDLTEGPGTEEIDEGGEPRRQLLKKHWQEDPGEARKVMEDIFDGVVRERLKDILRQYELRERHFECVTRSKELEVLLSRARAAEQMQLAEGEKGRADKADAEVQHYRQELETVQKGQSALIDKLIACCKEPNAERTQRLFASLREELERRGTMPVGNPDGLVGG